MDLVIHGIRPIVGEVRLPRKFADGSPGIDAGRLDSDGIDIECELIALASREIRSIPLLRESREPHQFVNSCSVLGQRFRASISYDDGIPAWPDS